MHTKDFDASAYEMIFHVVPEEAGFGHRHVFTDVAGGGDVVEVEVQGGALPQHTIIAHNRSVAMEAKKRRLEGGARIDSTNSTLCNINLFSLRSLEMDSILPDILRAGVVRRSVMPHPPTQWCTVKSWPVIIDHLKISNPHPRDARLVFEARDHMYFWDGTPTAGSVTKLIHTFTQPFDPDCVIAGMRAGANWPRPEYLKPYVAEDTLCFLRDSVHTKELVNLLCIKPRPNVEICQLVKNIVRQHPDLHNIVDLISMSDATIKKVWTRNADDASKQGTWMHMELECLLNGGFYRTCPQKWVSLQSSSMQRCLELWLSVRSGQFLPQRRIWPAPSISLECGRTDRWYFVIGSGPNACGTNAMDLESSCEAPLRTCQMQLYGTTGCS